MCAHSYIINRFPSKVLHNKTPFEILFDRKPDYHHLRAFGCLCFVTNSENYKDKFQPRAQSAVFTGYPFGKKGYKVLILDTLQIVASRNVIFNESIFPFHHHPISSISTHYIPNFIQDDFVSNRSTSFQKSDHTNITSTISSQNNSNSLSFDQNASVIPLPSRRSNRPHNLSSYLNDYICSTEHNSSVCAAHCFHTITNSFPLPKHISFSSLKLENQQILALLTTSYEPQTLEEAVIDSKLNSLKINCWTWLWRLITWSCWSLMLIL